jgi:ectoine hydroxylase-related dioxygenase (phytanoyl-CoA dioxygenase family)
MWIALDHVTLDSGSVEYIKGSHKWAKWYDPANFDVTGNVKRFGGQESEALRKAIESKEADGFEMMPDIERDRNKYQILSFDTEPGDCIVNHFLSVHSARGNNTDRNRRAVAFRFAGDDATFAVRKAQYRLRPQEDPGLKPGDPFPPNHHLFPQVWPRMRV